MAEMVQELLDIEELGQENIALVVITKSTPANAWEPPIYTPIEHPLKGVAETKEAKYDGTGALVRKAGMLITFAPPDISPELVHFISVNSRRLAITKLTRIPEAGIAVAWEAFCET